MTDVHAPCVYNVVHRTVMEQHVYHVFPQGDAAIRAGLDDVILVLPQTPDNDADVQVILEALRRIAARLEVEHAG